MVAGFHQLGLPVGLTKIPCTSEVENYIFTRIGKVWHDGYLKSLELLAAKCSLLFLTHACPDVGIHHICSFNGFLGVVRYLNPANPSASCLLNSLLMWLKAFWARTYKMKRNHRCQQEP